jgi:hypothetical protein
MLWLASMARIVPEATLLDPEGTTERSTTRCPFSVTLTSDGPRRFPSGRERR